MTIPTKSKVYAEDVPYFLSSQTAADTWIDRAKKEIVSINGKIQAEAFGADGSGRAAFMLAFTISDETFKVIWPVLSSRTNKEKAAKIQAATALYHDVKARVVSAKFLGARNAFFGYLMLSTGQTASEATSADFLDLVPHLMLGKGE